MQSVGDQSRIQSKIMEVQLKNHISTYLTDTFVEAIEKFQDLIQRPREEIQKLFKQQYINVFMGNQADLVIKKACSLSSGLNKYSAVELTVLRAISTSFYTFILAISEIPVLVIDEMYCIIIRTSDFEGPYFEPWKKGLGPMTELIIKQPFLSQSKSEDLQIIRVVIENAVIKKPSKFMTDFKDIKNMGNDFFKNGDYLSALNFYEYGLACCSKQSDYKQRAILYSNSAASMYKLNLFDDCLKYCDIATRIDKNYYKSYAWKVNSLLEKKTFGDIPNLLVIIQSKASPEDFTKINNKYSAYLSNSLGMYNWKSIAQQAKKGDIIACDYFSKFLSIRAEEEQNVYYSLQDIKKNSILVIGKALIYEKKGTVNFNGIYKKIIKCFQLQKSSYNCNFKDLLISNSGKQVLKEGTKLQSKDIQDRIRKYLIRPKDITASNESQTLGIWPELVKFLHSCNPNCSIVHFQSLMLISTNIDIKRGQILTVDFASDLPPLKRKQFLMDKFKICCKCTICEWKSLPDLNKDEISKVADDLTNIKVIKLIFWELISSGYNVQQQNFLEKYAGVMQQKQCNYFDKIKTKAAKISQYKLLFLGSMYSLKFLTNLLVKLFKFCVDI